MVKGAHMARTEPPPPLQKTRTLTARASGRSNRIDYELTRLDAHRLDSTWPPSTRLDSTRRNSTRLDSTRLAATRLDSI